MSDNETMRQEGSGLASKLWNMANTLRGKMDASEYQNYILGFIFYRYLSQKQNKWLASMNLLDKREGETTQQAYARSFEEDGADLWRQAIARDLGYVIDPRYTWTALVAKIRNHEIHADDFTGMLAQFRDNAKLNQEASHDLSGMFDEINLNASGLGNDLPSRTKALSALVEQIDSIDFVDGSSHDIIGDVYEYLIAEFASGAGKKAGEFYTPHAVSKVLAGLVTHTTPDASVQSRKAIEDENELFTVYDPAMGSGSLLLTVGDELKGGGRPGRVRYYGQELIRSTYNMARMNLIMHGVDWQWMRLNNADTLGTDWPSTEENGRETPLSVDAVVMNPPYSARWDNDKSRIKDPRFKEYGKLAPASKADYAFLLHGLYHLKPSGRMAILLPHGVLFRTGTEETIRKTLLERNYIDAVIGLPANLFHSTGIPTCVLVLRKDKKDHDVLFIDASQHFEKAKKQNRLREEDVELILDTYANRTDVDKLAHVATYQEIQDNESNLNIPRYVDTFEPEERIDLDQVNEELAETDKQIAELEAKFNALAADLVETRATED